MITPRRRRLLVCGAGASGIAAAIAAARAGSRVLLLERRSRMGGTVAHSLIHTLAGLFDEAGSFLNEGLCQELVSRLSRSDTDTAVRRMGRHWVLAVRPETYLSVVEQWVAEEENIALKPEAEVVRIHVDGDRVKNVVFAHQGRLVGQDVDGLILATGDDRLAEWFPGKLAPGRRDSSAHGLVARVKDVDAAAIAFPRSIGITRMLQEAVASGRLPQPRVHTWIDQGLAPDEAYVKIVVSREEASRPPMGSDWRLALFDPLLGYLRDYEPFKRARIDRLGDLGIRDGGGFLGRHVLAESDVRMLRKVPDPAAKACWPIEYWHPDLGVRLEPIAKGHDFYEIPLRALQMASAGNAWAVGKALSAEPLAQASARVVGSCWAMGEAAGKAASRTFHSEANGHA